MWGQYEVRVGSWVFTLSENVKMDDTEVEANEQMIRSVGGEKGRREERERESFLNARWKSIWHLSHYCGDGFFSIALTQTHITHTHTHTRRATSCNLTPPALHLVIKAGPRRLFVFSGGRKN